ncbi:MAG: hypothetical protein HXX08_24775 [Chloroflexi bacterium]|uniref:Uncharacterized protein n=1 Tax=Candidatus Chlorohelix allophototropha TaxID=3003348 RepID=A0A8T7MAC6_9CHLR|nr:hypothetical protein [Chloroflexota bacterium]WJW69013.1 hypothetical protein OZ401_002604 [Chloroflexota bacterium L227-S17]
MYSRTTKSGEAIAMLLAEHFQQLDLAKIGVGTLARLYARIDELSQQSANW